VHRSGGVVDCCQPTVTDAAALVPFTLVAVTEYDWLPADMLVVVHVDDELLQFDHEKVAGWFVQVAVSVMLCPVNGELALDATVHAGGAVGCGCHVTVTDAALPAPDPLTPATENVTGPAAADEAVHVAPLAEHPPVQLKLVGEPEQFAVSTTLVPAIGVDALDVTVHDGAAGFCQLTVADTSELLPTALVATTEYDCAPAAADVAVHEDPLLVQLVQA